MVNCEWSIGNIRGDRQRQCVAVSIHNPRLGLATTLTIHYSPLTTFFGFFFNTSTFTLVRPRFT